MSWVLILVLIIVGVVLYVWYVAIVTRRNRVEEALAGIDVQLQQRHDLIPNVLTIARRFMDHERALFEKITDLRNRASAEGGNRDFSSAERRFAVESQLSSDMGRLFALAENYPTLKSDGPMMEAQRAYSDIETNISAARRFYNSAVGDLRNAVQIFPGSILQHLAGVSALPPFFEADKASRQPVSASEYL